MINILIPITQNAKGYKKIIADLSSIEEGEIFIGVTTSQKDTLQYPNRENIHVIEYDKNFNEGDTLEYIFHIDDNVKRIIIICCIK